LILRSQLLKCFLLKLIQAALGFLIVSGFIKVFSRLDSFLLLGLRITFPEGQHKGKKQDREDKKVTFHTGENLAKLKVHNNGGFCTT
jgi:hypothetical protein